MDLQNQRHVCIIVCSEYVSFLLALLAECRGSSPRVEESSKEVAGVPKTPNLAPGDHGTS